MRTAFVLLALSLCGCGITEFRPRSANAKALEPIVRTASRVPNPSAINKCGADEIGVVRAEGEPEDVVAAIAEAAADAGGTHYVIRGDGTETTAADRYNPETKVRQTWAAVYRLPRPEWSCADFHPHER